MLYSAKCFAAAMLALYIALALDLPRPFWAVLTTYVVANPLSGVVRSKALYRVLGTIGGAVMTVFLVPRFANSPELLSLALAGWVGLCLYISLLDRTPRAYVFMLAGYSAALIGFPSAADPANVFATALARVEEITIGIVCATVVHSLIIPQSLGPVLLARVDRAIQDAQSWMADVIGNTTSEAGSRARRTLAAEISEIRVTATHLPFDTSHLRWTGNLLHALQDRLTSMVPLLLAIEDRLAALQQVDAGRTTLQWRTLLDDIAAWIQQGNAADPLQADRLQAAIAQLAPVLGPQASWSALLQINLATRLQALIDACREGISLRAQIDITLHGGAPDVPYRLPAQSPAVLHVDRGLALRSAFTAMAAILFCCAFWIVTAWPSGSAAPMMAAIFCSFYAAQDDPVPNIRLFLNYTVLSIPISAIYVLVAVPAVHSFEMLVLVLAPVFLILGIYAGRPATTAKAVVLIFGVAGTLALHDTGSLELAPFANSMLAQIAGYGAAALFSALLRSVTPASAVLRLRRAVRSELVSIGASRRAPELVTVSVRMLDRIGLLTPRLASSGGAEAGALDTLGDLRVGLNMVQLRQLESSLTAEGITLTPLMRDLSAHFRREPGQERSIAPALLDCIDATLRQVCKAAAGTVRLQAATSLTSLRRDLFAASAPYQPALGAMATPAGASS